MRPGKQERTGQQDLFRARLDQIINMQHELVRLVQTIEGPWIDREGAGCFSEEGRPGLRFAYDSSFGLSIPATCQCQSVQGTTRGRQIPQMGYQAVRQRAPRKSAWPRHTT